MCYWQNNEILVMVLLGKKPLTLILSCICYVSRNCYANLSSDSDDDSLKEALVLVDILKKEYIKALRENVAGIYREDNNNTIFEDQSTCAPTTIEEKYNISTSSQNKNGQALSQQVPENSSDGTENHARQWSSYPPHAPHPALPDPTLLASMAPQARSSEKLFERASSRQISSQPLLHQTLLSPRLLAPIQGLYSSVQYHMTPVPEFPMYGENLQRPYRGFRRRMPRDYYGFMEYYDQPLNPRFERPWRNNIPFNSRRKNTNGARNLRLNNEYPIEAHPNNGATTTTAVLTTTKTTIRTTENRSKASFVPGSKSKNNFTLSNTSTKMYTENNNKLESEAYIPIKTYGKMMARNQVPIIKNTLKSNIPTKFYRNMTAPDPVQDQVNAELVNEIENDDESQSLDKQNDRTKTTALRIPIRSTTAKKELGYYKKNDGILDFIKTTIRIHLGRSTRYPIPFPENHAFCFTNPKSGLCRTQF